MVGHVCPTKNFFKRRGKNEKIFFLLLIFLCLWAVNLSASIVSWNGSIEKTSEPSDLSLGAYETSNISEVFDEKQNYVLERGS